MRRRTRRLTIRARATTSAVVVMAIAVAIASFGLVALLRQSLLNNLDQRAELRMQDLNSLLVQGQVPDVLGGNEEDGTVAQILVGNQIISQSPVVLGTERLADFEPAPSGLTKRTVSHVPIREGRAYRVVAAQLETPFGTAKVYVAVALQSVNDTLGSLQLLLAIVGPALVLFVGATTWYLAGRTLAPVEAIRQQVADISASELSRRVPEPGTHDEIQRLAETMNAMLGRLDSSAEAQRMFVSDAAHELRSPLAAIRAELEVARAAPPSDEWSAVLDRVAMSSARLERLVEELLTLASAEERGQLQWRDVDLDEVVLTELEPLRMNSGLTIDINGLNAARVTGDRHALEHVVANLLDNASRHAATNITVELGTENGHAVLVVADDGPGVPVEDRQRIFDRFTRLDEARDRRRGGAGLGLAITRRIIEHHGGTIAFGDSDRGARIVVTLPAEPFATP